MGVLGSEKLGVLRLGAPLPHVYGWVDPFRVELRDANGLLLAIFENAIDVGYEFIVNQLAAGSFALPVDDEKRALIEQGTEVWIYEDGALVETFRLKGRSMNRSANIPVTRTYMYVVVAESSPAKIVTIRLPDMYVLATLTLESGEDNGRYIVVDGDFAYVSVHGGWPVAVIGTATIVKIDLRTFTRVSAITLNSGEQNVICMAVGAGHLFVGCYNDTGPLVKVDLTTFTRESSVSFASGERICSVVTIGNYVYVAAGTYLRKLNAATLVEVANLSLGEECYGMVALYDKWIWAALLNGEMKLIKASTMELMDSLSVDSDFLAAMCSGD